MFSKRCYKCKEGFSKNDLVMRANQRIYHVNCFRCSMCEKQLAPGDEFALRTDLEPSSSTSPSSNASSGLLCKLDNEIFEKQLLSNPATTPLNTSCQNITNTANFGPNSGGMLNPPGANKMLKCAGIEDNQANEFEGS